MDEQQKVAERVSKAQKILVGIGEEFQPEGGQTALLDEAYSRLAKLLFGRDYYIVTLQEDEQIYQYDYDRERIAAPCREDAGQWKKYQEWLAYTLNKELLILELGVGFALPELIRWPFEKVAFYNHKAYLLRINGKFPQLTSELAQKGTAVRQNSLEFCANL